MRTIDSFYDTRALLKWLLKKVQSITSSGGSTSTEVITQNSDSITFSGNGTEDDPLTAEASGGGSTQVASGLHSDDGIIKLGSNPSNPYDGIINEPTSIYALDSVSGALNQIQIVPGALTNIGVSGGGLSSSMTVTPSNLEIKTSALDTLGGVTGENALKLTGQEITVSGDENFFKGVIYDKDYSTTYTDRSLVDKAYVDSRIPTNPPVYADNTAATNDGLAVGAIYRKADGTLMIRY